MPRRPASKGAPSDDPEIIWIGVRASEFNLQRLAAYLMFAQYPGAEEFEKRLAAAKAAGRSPMVVLPGEEEEEELPPMDPELARQEITKLVPDYIKRHGVEWARRTFSEYGGSKLSEIPEHKLGDLLADMQRSLAGPEKGK